MQMKKLEYESSIEFSVGSKKYTLEYSENIEFNKNSFWIKINDKDTNSIYTSPKLENQNFLNCILYLKKFGVWANKMCKKEGAVSFKLDDLKLTMIVKEHDEDGYLGEVSFELHKQDKPMLTREIAKIKGCKEELTTNKHSSSLVETIEKFKEDIRILAINSKEKSIALAAKVEGLKNSLALIESKVTSLIDKQELFAKESKLNIEKKVSEIKDIKEANSILNCIQELVEKTPLEMSEVKFLSEFEYIDFVKNKILPQTTFSKLILLFDTNIHGDLSSSFHEKCDNKGPTVTFVWDEKGNIFGGFTNLSWTSSGEYKEEKKSFLFSVNKQKIFHIDNNFDKAIYDARNWGPIFGGGNDLWIKSECTKNNKSGQNLKNSYGSYGSKDNAFTKYEFTGAEFFKVKEYKVFSVTD